MYLTRNKSLLLFIGAVAALCAVELWVAASPAFPANSTVFAAVITADLLVGIPLLFYGLVVRPYRLSPTTIAPIFLLAFMFARYILPPTGRQYLDMATILIVLIEAMALGVVVWKARRIVQHYQQHRPQSVYFIDALDASVRAVVGAHPAVRLFTIEFVLIFLAVFGWFMRYRARNAEDKVFTYHRTSRYSFIFAAFLTLMILEAIGFHLLIQHWSPRAAWILTILSIYGLFWVVGEFTALRLLPIVLVDDTLHLRSGFRWSTTLRLMDIVDVQRPMRANAKASDYVSFARGGDPHLVIVLKHPVRVHGIFGMGKQATRIGLFLDEAGDFLAALDQRRSH